MKLDKYTKAIVGAALAGLGAYQTAILDNHVTQSEWVNITIFTLTALVGVWGVSNSDVPRV